MNCSDWIGVPLHVAFGDEIKQSAPKHALAHFAHIIKPDIPGPAARLQVLSKMPRSGCTASPLSSSPRHFRSRLATTRPSGVRGPHFGMPVSLSARHTVACEAVMSNGLTATVVLSIIPQGLLSQERGLYAYSGEGSNEHGVCKIDWQQNCGVPQSQFCASASLLRSRRPTPYCDGTNRWHVYANRQHEHAPGRARCHPAPQWQSLDHRGPASERSTS